MRFIAMLLIIFWTIWYILTTDVSDGIKWVIVWWFIWFAGTYFQARTSNYFNIQEQGDEVLSLFWRYQDLKSRYTQASDDMKENADSWVQVSDERFAGNDKFKERCEKEYDDSVKLVDDLSNEKQTIRERFYSKAFIYFPKTANHFRNYTVLEVWWKIESNSSTDIEQEIQTSLLSEIKSHKSFFI